MTTIPDVYVIESLDPDDEGNGRLEGLILTNILKLHEKIPKYEYVRTPAQFRAAVGRFGQSKYRYLHVSAHGDREGMRTTNQDDIDYDELGEILTPHLKNRRLFLSACSMVHQTMAKAIIPATGCYSIVGPKRDIRFTDAAVVWASIYHLMFTKNDTAMKRSVLKSRLMGVSELFDVELSYFSAADNARGYTGDLLGKGFRKA